MKSRNKGFDCIKAIACVAVVLIHFNFKGETGKIVATASRFAVPVFFLISGYFLSNPDRQIRKLVRLLLVSTVLFGLFCYGCEYVKNHGELMPWIGFAEKYLSTGKIVKFFITNNGLFSAPLWFVGALIYCNLFILVFFPNETSIRFARWLIVPLLCGLYSMEEFSRVLGIKWKWMWVDLQGLNGKDSWCVYFLFIFRAFPFFMLGNLLRAMKGKIETFKIPNWIFAILAVCGCFMAIGEYYLLSHRVVQFYLGSTLTAVSLMILAIRAPNVGAPWLAWFGSELSMLVYILHPGIGKFMFIMADLNHWWGTSWFHPCKFIIVFVLSVILSLIVVCLMRMLRRVSSRISHRAFVLS